MLEIILTSFRTLFFGNKSISSTLTVFMWLVRLVLLSLLLRTFIIPWLLASTSKRIRVRSISLRSIRGLYIRAGIHECRVERITYAWTHANGERRINIIIEGLNLVMSAETPIKHARHKRNLTLAHLSPSPFARLIWELLGDTYAFLDPYVRPYLRAWVVKCLRFFIRWLPRISRAVTFDLHSATVTLPDTQKTEINTEKMKLHTLLSLTPLETSEENLDSGLTVRAPPLRPPRGVGAFRRRVREGFERSLDRALGDTRATANVSLQLQGVHAMTGSQVSGCKPLVQLRGRLDFNASVSFNPRAGSMEDRSLEATMRIGDCVVHADSLLSFLNELGSGQFDPEPMPVSRSNAKAPDDILETPASVQPTGSFSLNSPLPTLDSPFFSPILSSKVPSISALASPASPFLEAISTSLRSSLLSHRQQLVVPCQKLTGYRCNSVLSFLQRIQVTFSKVNVVYIKGSNSSEQSYHATFQNITLEAFRSSPVNCPLHVEVLGRCDPSESYDPEVYGLSLSVGATLFERHTIKEVWHLLTVGQINLSALASQWPFPLLTASPFMSADPNAPILALRVHIAGATFTERLEDLRSLLNPFGASNSKITNSGISVAPKPFPKLSLQISNGPLVVSVICKPVNGHKPFVVQFMTKGFSTSSSSHYQDSKWRSSVGGFERETHMVSETSLMLEPVFVVVHTESLTPGFATHDPDGMESMNHPTALSLGVVDVRCRMGALATIDDRIGAIAHIDTSTVTFDTLVSTEVFCIELWHPGVVTAISQVLTVLLSTPGTNSDSLAMSARKFGVSMSVGLGRLVLFTTSPDLNPHDDLSLSRGIALRTVVSLQWCSLASRHLLFLGDFHERSLTRQKLDLAQDLCIDAAAASRQCEVALPQISKISVSNLLVRGAVATPFETDDHLMAERDGVAFIDRDFFRAEHAEFKILGGPGSPLRIFIHVPAIKLNFELLHVYELMLALQNLCSLQQIRTQTSASHTNPNRVFVIEANLASIQIAWTLPKQKLLTDIRDLAAGYTNGSGAHVQFNQIKLSTLKDPDDGDNAGITWDELADLQMWRIQIPRTRARAWPEVIISGTSALVRIPFGYIFADLVFDIVVVAKAVRHLVNMVNAGAYQDFPEPEAEAPKIIPQLKFFIKHVTLEASDDPFESRLGLIWRTGVEAVKMRLEREKAFEAKVATIHAAEKGAINGHLPGNEYHFDATHTISVQEARQRLDEVHALDWIFRLGEERRKVVQTEQTFIQRLRSTVGGGPGSSSVSDAATVEDSASVRMPPLFRGVIFDLDLKLTPPSFSLNLLPDFLLEQGHLPSDTSYSLVAPMHLHFTLSSLHATLRNYPLPLISIPAPQDTRIALECSTDIVIAEEMGTQESVEWIECPIIQRDQGAPGVLPLSITVPKTIMPVKSYANPVINVTTSRPTTFTWGISYGPAIQDLMRIIDTLSSASRDESPPIGFWDKMKLILHWTCRVSFESEVLLHLKGSRDPYHVVDDGAGFVLCWKGNTKLLINRENDDKEMLQVTSDSLTFAVPDLDEVAYNQSHSYSRYRATAFRKVCASLQSSVRFGVGVVLERSCSPRCTRCSGSAFQRECRIFSFVPHHKIKFQKKKAIPEINSQDDSFSGFRSDFVHLSVSLTSSSRPTSRTPNSFHLSTKLFAHFWSWWTLFDGALSLPIRQGSFYPRRIITPKLGRHLATIKYRIAIPHLYVMHGYLDDSEETWIDGVTPWVGLKGLIDHFQADFHQRDEEAPVIDSGEQSSKSLRRKAFCAAEVVLKGIDLRTLVATFAEPEKRAIKVPADMQRSNYRARTDLPKSDLVYPWYDPMDYVEIDWSSVEAPNLHILPIATCPYFAYFKRDTAFSTPAERLNKFGVENSHTCLLGGEPSVYHVQIALAEARIAELKQQKHNCHLNGSVLEASRFKRMITLLEEYTSLISASYTNPDNHRARNYLMPSETVSPYEWADFDNVYQVHSPTIYLDAAIRDILMRYYYCSRSRQGFEYHLATRAVKFIRDQAIAAINDLEREPTLSATQVAASALRRILRNEDNQPSDDIFSDVIPESLDAVDPLHGWSDGVSLKKGHYCLLLKPQVVLRGELDSEPCVVAAIQAKLQSFSILDDTNANDPISGKVMSRNYAALLGLQAFSPSGLSVGQGRVPLEVLVDLKCESKEFDRLVPQTDAMFHYDKFNRLRLRNSINSVAERGSKDKASPPLQGTSHLRDQTDLLRIHIPRFTVSASDKHFQCIANIVTELILFSDAAHKTRLARLDNLLIKYDFTDLFSAAVVVENLQTLLRNVLENGRQALFIVRQSNGGASGTNLLHIRARALALAEELHLLFDAIRLAQDESNVKSDRKSALLLHASSSLMSWNMLAGETDLLSKLQVQETNFYWLSRQDGSTVNNLRIGNLEAFDGSQNAQWAEILSKHDEPANHPLLKRGLLLVADWIVLPPVGGISVYENFELSLHPVRLQIDSRVGRRIMEYFWPARKDRYNAAEDETEMISEEVHDQVHQMSPTRMSLDSPRALESLERQGQDLLSPPMRKLAGSRSFADLRSPKATSNAQPITNFANHSAESLISSQRNNRGLKSRSTAKSDAATEMRTRSSQKTFILVKVSSLDILLSVLKEGSFECHDAHIRTRQLEYRDKTWSFEELVDQFIPSNMTWRGWVKMALQQPLLPVFPVARELFMKTKFSRSGSPAIMSKDEANWVGENKNSTAKHQFEGQKQSALRKLRRKQNNADLTPPPMAGDTEALAEDRETTRTRVFSIFGRGKR